MNECYSAITDECGRTHIPFFYVLYFFENWIDEHKLYIV